jgi:hypothetical protein
MLGSNALLFSATAEEPPQDLTKEEGFIAKLKIFNSNIVIFVTQHDSSSFCSEPTLVNSQNQPISKAEYSFVEKLAIQAAALIIADGYSVFDLKPEVISKGNSCIITGSCLKEEPIKEAAIKLSENLPNLCDLRRLFPHISELTIRPKEGCTVKPN